MTNQMQAEGRKGLGRVALIGSVLQMAGRGLRALIGVGTVAILARFLTPSDFGAFALIYAVVMLAQVFADLGLRVALVQKTDITDLECDSVFWASTLSGIGLAVLIFLLAQPIADLFDSPEIADSIRVVSPIFIIIGMRGVPLALLERRFMFKQIAWTDFASAVIGSLAAIAFASAGYTVGALVAQQVAMILTLAVMLFLSARWLPRFRFSLDALRPLASYGSYVTLTGLLFSVGPMINRPLISTRLSTSDLGYLTIADQLVMTPVRVIGNSVNRVTFPLLASIKSENARIVTAHQNTVHALALTLAPLVIGIAALAEPITLLLLGQGWAMVTIVLALYAPRALIVAVGELNGSVFSAKGQARFQFQWGVFTLLISIGVLILSLPFGVEAVALGQLATSIVLALLIHTWFLARLLGTTTFSLLRPMARPLFAAALMGTIVYLLDQSLETAGLSILLRAVLGTTAGGLAYLATIVLVDRQALLELWGKVRTARRTRAG